MSQEIDIPPVAEINSALEPQKPPVKKRRWLRRFIWLFIILAVFIYLISGVGARKAGEYFINKSLEEQGMTGSLELLGSVNSGFQLKNLHYTGEKGIQLLEIDEVDLDYKLTELKDFKIDLLKVKRLKTIIDIDKFPPSQNTDPNEPTNWKENLGSLKPILTNPEIDISELDITILKSVKKMAHFQLGGIQHIANSNEIALVDWKVTDADGLSTPTQSSKLIWNDKSISFDSLELIPNLALGDINFDWENELQGNASIDFHDSSIHLDVDQNETQSITLNLIQGEVRAADVFKTLNSFGISTDPYDSEISLNKLSVNLPLSKKLAQGDFNIDWQNELLANLGITYYDAAINLDLNQDETKSIALDLTEGTLKTANIFNTLNKLGISTEEYDAEVTVNKLSASMPVSNLEIAPPLWKINSSLGIQSARYENYTAKNTIINFNQEASDYQLTFNGITLESPLDLDIKGKWNQLNKEKFWEYTDVKLDLKTQLNDSIISLIPELQEIPNDIDISRSKISLTASSSLSSYIPGKTTAEVELSSVIISNHPLPSLGIKANFENNILNLDLRSKQQSSLLANAEVDIQKSAYLGSFTTKTSTKESPWINALAKIYDAPINLVEELDIQWKGSGNLTSNKHQGTLTSEDLIITQIEENGEQNDPITINLTGEYNWPESINLKNIDISQQELFATASLNWNGETVTLEKSQIQRYNETIANISGNIPFNLEIDNAKKFFNQTKDWQLTIDTEELRLQRISEFIPLPNNSEITGSLKTTLKVTGSPKEPTLNGNFDINSLNDVFELGLGKITLNSNFKTQNKSLTVEGKIIEIDKQLVDLSIKTPFKPNEWIEDDNLIKTLLEDSEILGTANIKRFPLNRLDNFVPELERIEGLVDVHANFKGTVTDPKYKISFLADLPIVSLKDAGVDDITEIKLSGDIDETMMLKSLLTAKINGGKFRINANADLNNPTDPVFDVNLATDHALVYRDESVALRTSVNLKLAGNIEDATLSGQIGILESLFFQDVDLIPIGVPSTTVETVSLPSIDTQSTTTLPIPAPFDKWKLDLTLKAVDPILIRGNIGNGRVEGSVKIKGVIGEPSLDGSFYTKSVSAKLPFSQLKINTGKIIFKPNKGFIPQIQVLGKSQIGEYNVTVNAYGSADNPQLTLSSFPALPETEIMTLLATGATNAGLTNADVATFKTLQLLLLELKQRSEKPDGNRLFVKLLDGIDQLNLKVGEVNELTGEKFASATFKLHRRWFLSAQIDDGQPPQTRGLLIFALRFN